MCNQFQKISLKKSISLTYPAPSNNIGDGPEIPEVRCFAEKLNKLVKGKTLTSISIINGPYRYSQKDRYIHFRECIDTYVPHKVKIVDHYGKLLFFRLKLGESEKFLCVHAGMEGSWCRDIDNKHIILGLMFDEEEEHYFQDSRRFGTFYLLTKEEFDQKIKTMGPDVYKMDSDIFLQRCAIKKYQNKRLCELCLDQSFVAGLGNYLRADILYLSRLNPCRILESLSDREKKRWYRYIKKVILKSYNDKATTCGSYESAIHHGKYEPLVYHKDICPQGYRVKSFQDKNKRMMWWVPKIQK
jgi:formamidopyrimidine-DNA glycosylase